MCWLALIFMGVGGAGGSGAPDVARVEEDWEVVLNEPEQNLNAPQFHTFMSPFDHIDSYHFQVRWNHHEAPNYDSGGVQIQAWSGEDEAGMRNYREDELSSSAETIRWTQVLSTQNGQLRFQIDDGTSETWGSFGGSETSLTGAVGVWSLNQYNTYVSLENSIVSFGANRIDMLRITAVRRYQADGTLISEDKNPKVVFQYVD